MKKELYESAYWVVKVDEDNPNGNHYWEGAGADDKDSTRFDYGEELKMDPNHFPVGTRVDVSEPEDPDFYEKLFGDK